jgi:decaprenylphospho-beta-D-ribofuranose 2-oxidase
MKRDPALRQYVSLDRRDRALCEWRRPDRYRNLFDLPGGRKLIAHGSALSLAGAGFSRDALAIDMTKFDRLLNFDAGQRRVTVEAGATLGKLLEFLLPQGLTVPVLPGYPFLTVGGCIAGNVHGKNQYREGCFANIVEELTLYHPRRGLVTINRESNGPLFYLTCGGFGLTGIIVSATLRVESSRGSWVEFETLPIENIEQAVDIMLSRRDGADFLHSWHDLSRPKAIGRGFVSCGILRGPEQSTPTFGRPRISPSVSRPRLPLIRPMTLPWMNRLYALKTRLGPARMPLVEALFPWIGKESYFDLVGDEGVIEPQVLVPFDNIQPYMSVLLSLMRKYDCSAPLATLKIFGGDQKMLWYSGPGISVSLHLFNNQGSMRLLSELDDANIQFGVITNLLKDSRVSAEAARRQYRDYDTFSSALRAHDPERIFESSLSTRLAL